MKYIIQCPFDHGENDYIALMIQSIRAAGYEPVPEKGNRIRGDCILLNWFENIPTESRMKILFKKFVKLFLYRLLGKRIIWVMHNRHPHEGKDPYSLFMMKFLARFSDRIMVLCDDTIHALQEIMPLKNITRKVYKVPLVSYQSLVGSIPEKKRGDTLNLLLFGRIQPYKCIETLIEAVQSTSCVGYIRLNVVGSCRNTEYAQQLQKLAENTPNIHIDPRFISLDELKELAADADAFVLPMDHSCLNSSAVMMAFSLGRTVICPWIGTMHEYTDVEDFAYCYDYQSSQEHVDALQRAIEQAYIDCMSSESGLSIKGQHALQTVTNKNSIDAVAESFQKMIDSFKK